MNKNKKKDYCVRKAFESLWSPNDRVKESLHRIERQEKENMQKNYRI